MGALLPPEEFVRVAAAQGLLLVVGAAAASTVPWLTAQQVLRAGTGAGADAGLAAAARSSVAVAALLAVAAAGGTALVAGFATPAERVALAVAAALLCCGQVAVGWAQGTLRFHLLAALVVGEVLVKVVAGAAAALVGAGAAGVVWSAGAGALVLVGAAVHLVRGHWRPAPGARAGGVDRRTVAGVGAVRALVSAVMVVDVVLVAAVLTPGRAVADYQLAMSLGRVPVFLATSVAQAYLAVLVAAPLSRAPRDETWRQLLVAAVPAAAVIATVPPSLLLAVLPGGADLAVFVPLAALTGLAMGLLQLVSTWAQAGARWRRLVGALGAALALHAAAVLVGAWAGGVHGVAVATAASAAALVALGAVLASRGVGLRARPPASVLVMAAALVLTRPVDVAWLLTAAVCGALTLRALLPARRTAGAAP
jgi:O-antigen/teichoic acid export membrane protein